MGTSNIEHKEEEESKEERLDQIVDGLDSKEADDEGEEKEEGDEEGQETEAKEEGVKEEEKVSVLTPEESNRELRQIVREQKRQMAMMQAKLDRLDKRSTVRAKAKDEDDLFFEDDASKTEEKEELSDVEKLQSVVESIGVERGPILEVLVETMEQNKEYADIRDVCSQNNFDDIFESVGKAVSDKEGIDPLVAQLEFEARVWSMPNPYKYMYGLIKEYHPSYAKPEESKETDTETKDKDTSGRDRKPAEAPTSIASIKGSDTKGSSGWSAERIDSLPEDELHKVPKDVYDKYLAGELD